MISEFIKQLYDRVARDKAFAPILHGMSIGMMSRVGQTALALLGSMVTARFFGADALGVLSLVTAVLSVVIIFTVFGTGTSILRLIPEHIARYSTHSAFQVYKRTQGIVIVFSGVVGALVLLLSGVLASKLLGRPDLGTVLAWTSGVVVFKSLMVLNTQAVRGLGLVRMFAFLQLLPYVLFAGAVLVAAALPLGRPSNAPVYAQLIAWCCSGAVGTAVMHIAFRRRLEPSGHVHNTTVGEILAMSQPMLLSASMAVIMGQTGVILLGIYQTPAEVGYYAIAVKLAMLTTFVLQSVNVMSAPTFSKLYNEDKVDELLRVARKSTLLIFWLTVPILLVLLVFGPLVLGMFGEDFKAAYPAMVVLVFGQLVNSVSGSTGYFMNMTGNQRPLRDYMMLAAGINVLVSMVLIPRYGAIGAAAASCASTVFWNVCSLRFIKRTFGRTLAYVPLVQR